MAYKVNKGHGKGSLGASQGRINAKEDMLKGRKLVSDSRFVGSISEWHQSWGWLEPLDVISHPQIKKNKGRVYVNRSDTRSAIKNIDVGTKLDFQMYCDARGLGAVDCIQVQAEAVKAAAAVVAASGEDLPEGWDKHWSAEHSEYFYWNQSKKETSWVLPESVSKKDDDDDLPSGWSKQLDPDNKESYYWDKVNKKASWERPTAPAKKKGQAQEGPPAKKAKVEAEGGAADAPVLGQQRLRGRVVEWHGFYGSIQPLKELSEDLRPLLEQGQGHIYLNWRDVNPGLEIEVEMEVDFMLYEDDNGLAASDVRLPGAARAVGTKQSAVAGRLARQWAQEDAATNGDLAEAAAAAEQGDDEENSGPLLPGWEQMWSDEHDRNYYWHKATKVAAWERPSLPASFEDEEEEEQTGVKEEKVWDGEGCEEGAFRKATPMTPLVSMAGRAMTPATPGASQANVRPHPSQRAPQVPTPNSQQGKGAGRKGSATVFRPIKSEQPKRRY